LHIGWVDIHFMKKILKQSARWTIIITVITFMLAAIFTVISTVALNGVGWISGLAIVLSIVLIGIFFDMIGIAATAADEVPFHAMASNRIHGAKHSIRIIRNADRFASFCNDVIGDISGIVSGTATAIVIVQLSIRFNWEEASLAESVGSIILTSLIAALTVGGKAMGKTLAIRYSKDIIFAVGKLLYFLEEHFQIVIIKENKGKRPKRKRNESE
jgi:CBS domain containing-hemolysin-like protein